MTFPAPVPEIPAANVDKAPAYYVNTLGFTFLYSSIPGGVQRLRAQAGSLSDLAAAMGRYVDHPIFDRTGLTGGFDLDLTFLPQVGGPAPGDQGDAPFIFNAVQEQLGLKLEAAKTPIEILVIDSIDHPTEN